MTTTRTRRTEDPAAKAIAATRRLAAHGGYEAVQMREVVRQTGMSSATIYRLFSSKDHLIAAAHLDWVRSLDKSLKSDPVDGVGAEAVAGLLHRSCTAIERSGGFGTAMIRAMASRDPNVHACQREVKEITVGMIRDLAAEETDAPDEYAELLGYAWRGALDSWAYGNLEITRLDDVLQRLARQLMAGMRAHDGN